MGRHADDTRLMGKRKSKERGRPMKAKNRYPPRVDATADDMARAMFSLPADHEWEYEKAPPEYRCSDCGEAVHYPDTLYRDGRCEACHRAVRV